MDTVQDIQFLTLPGKGSRLSFDDTGDNEKTLNKPLLVCIPGIGDSRTQFRHISPVFHNEGYRVVRIDLRGMGASSTDFDDYKPESFGEDIHLIVQQLHNYNHDRGYIIVGNSFGAAAAVWNAAEYPDEVKGLIFLGPVLRDIPLNFFMTNLLRALFGPFWGASAWGSYYKSIHVNKPADLDDYTKQVVKMIKEPGRKDVLYNYLWESKQVCTDRIDAVKCPVLVLIGDKDPDFSDPSEEAKWIESAFKKDLVTYRLLHDCGHYPHVEYVDVTWTEIASFLEKKILTH